MAKVHDKYVVELAEIIKGYGNDPDINDPFCLSEFYRFYEVPNVCVSAENFKKMRPLSDYTEEIEPESISKWKKEFREYVDSLNIARDDWKGIVEYIDELPSVQPEIIRCKDCKCWHPQFKTENGNGLGSCDFHDVALVTSKGFCYWAERKE